MSNNKNFWCSTNVKLWREMPHVGLEIIADVHIAFFTGEKDILTWEINDIMGFKQFTYGGKEIHGWQEQKKIIDFLKETLGIALYQEIEDDMTDIVNDMGITEYLFEQTGLRYNAPEKPKKCKTCGK